MDNSYPEPLKKTSGSKWHNDHRGQKDPHLAAVVVGNDGASETYVGAK